MYSQDEIKENSMTKIRYIIATNIPNEIFKCHKISLSIDCLKIENVFLIAVEA